MRPEQLEYILRMTTPLQQHPLTQLSQWSQLPWRPLTPQMTRIPTHKQHLSQWSQLSQQ